MIDPLYTITATIDKALNKLRFLGNNDVKLFRKILNAVILTDMIEWVDFLDLDDETQSLQIKLSEMRNQIFLKNCDFDVKYIGNSFYTSTNIPGGNDDWKLVKDAPIVNKLQKEITPTVKYDPWEPDLTYTPITVYFTEYKDITINRTTTPVPNIDVSKLTTREKMNIYVDNTDPTAPKYWRLTEDCLWEQLHTSQNVDEGTLTDIVNNKLKNCSIAQFTEDSDKLHLNTKFVTDESDITNQIQLATNDDINNLL